MIHNSNSFTNCVGHFLNAWDCTGESETAERISEIVVESIDLAKSLYKANIYAVVSDNASTMVKMGKNVQHLVWHNTCNSHTANLLAKDISNKKITENVNSILKEFKQSDFEKAIVDKGGKKMKLACETRWCSNRDACASLLFNLQHMKQIIIDERPKKVKSTVAKLVFDDEFIEDVKKEKHLLDPICELINICEKNDSSIADSARLWLEMNSINMDSNMLAKFEKRKKMALSKYALTAYYLNPFFDKNILNEDQMEIISHFLLENLNAEGLEDWYLYKTRSGFFQALYEKQITKPEVFWAAADMKHKKLADLAMKLLNIPASSAQIERLFSNWGHIHSSLRNMINFDHSKKLLHVYFTLNNKVVEYDSH